MIISDQEKCEMILSEEGSTAMAMSAPGKVREMRKWWDVFNAEGPKFGYFPNSSKTVLIIKDPDNIILANEILKNYSHSSRGYISEL